MILPDGGPLGVSTTAHSRGNLGGRGFPSRGGEAAPGQIALRIQFLTRLNALF